MSRLAVIDLGSSTVKLTIAEVTDANVSIIHSKQSSSFPLGEDIAQIGKLRKKTIAQNAQLIKGWQKKLNNYDVVATRMVSTGAARRASNKSELISILKEETGLNLEIIRGYDEAKILFKAVVYDLPSVKQPLAILNVGGSSTELILGSQSTIDALYSFDKLGVRDLRQILKSDPPANIEYSGLIERIKYMLMRQKLSQLQNGLFFHTGGELDYMMSAGYPLTNRPFSSSHPKKISLVEFERHSELLRKKTREELRKLSPNPNNPEWMDGAIVCNALAGCIAKALGVSEIIPSNRNLIDGLLLQLKYKTLT